MGMETLIPVGMSLLSNLAKSGGQGAAAAPQQDQQQAQQGPQGWSMVQPPTGGMLSQQQGKPAGIFDMLNSGSLQNGSGGLLKSILGMM